MITLETLDILSLTTLTCSLSSGLGDRWTRWLLSEMDEMALKRVWRDGGDERQR
jgi:hypothetical protein